ncbi:lipopolysaccharide biosynthesis protein [Algoriphagus namhaensis]
MGETSKTKNGNPILRNMAKLATGVGLAKIVNFGLLPIITRIYSPSDFAILAIFVSFIVILSPLSSFLYTTAIPLPRKDSIAINLSVLSLSILFISVLSQILIFSVFGKQIFDFFSAGELYFFWYLIPIGVICFNVYDILSHWALRKGLFTSLSISRFFQTLTGSLSKIAFGWSGFGLLGLLIGQVLTQSSGMFTILQKLYPTFKEGRSNVRLRLIKFSQKKFIDFPKYRLPSELLMQVTLKLPIFYFGVTFSQQEVGQLSLAIGILAVPLSFFGNTTSQAYYSHIAELGVDKSKEIYSITKSLIVKLFLSSIIPGIVLMIYADYIFSFIFGDNWEMAGTFASILAIYLVFQFVYSPIGNGVFNVFNKQKLNFNLNVIRFFLIVSSFYVSYVFNLSSFDTLLFFSFSISFFYLISIFFVYRILLKNRL